MMEIVLLYTAPVNYMTRDVTTRFLSSVRKLSKLHFIDEEKIFIQIFIILTNNFKYSCTFITNKTIESWNRVIILYLLPHLTGFKIVILSTLSIDRGEDSCIQNWSKFLLDLILWATYPMNVVKTDEETIIGIHWRIWLVYPYFKKLISTYIFQSLKPVSPNNKFPYLQFYWAKYHQTGTLEVFEEF
jgi:hypothetical protein